MSDRVYIAIDLKSFYASVECMELGRDPLTTNLVVADASRTEKTICLAVSPSLKSYGISGRARLFEVVQKVKEVNIQRRKEFSVESFCGESSDFLELKKNPSLAVAYVIAPPRMALYMEYSAKIYQLYLKYVAEEDIHVYSIDEVMMDVTDYLRTYGLTARELAQKIIENILSETGITATAGIGTNLYLCKIAMDIVAKHVEPDANGVRIAQLDEMSYRKQLWNHRPLTDFWRVGPGYARKLEKHGLYTMGDIARCSLGGKDTYYNEDLLYQMFGVNAELLIDHAWGWEPCRISDVKAYKPENTSLCSGQVLTCPYTAEKAKLVVREMADLMSLNLVEKGLVTDQLVLTVGYDIENLTNPDIQKQYHGDIIVDRYGRKIPKHAHGTGNVGRQTASTRLITQTVMALYDRIINPQLLVRRVTLSANHLVSETEIKPKESYEQMNLFTDYEKLEKKEKEEQKLLDREKKMQQAIIELKKKYGKNAVLKGMNLEKGATTITRNGQIGGHNA